ncbi:hypothetical protein BB559_003703 [Furculomyces boomerangus]|uniref:Uncharacterized protein n=1 Tax=Furculomyces boomerangus TaxID=61424 RepID=A0A2T9YJH8_9FUNG|nr:hypothetical protein BB559_003703 [Furculomyces boomerangus]
MEEFVSTAKHVSHLLKEQQKRITESLKNTHDPDIFTEINLEFSELLKLVYNLYIEVNESRKTNSEIFQERIPLLTQVQKCNFLIEKINVLYYKDKLGCFSSTDSQQNETFTETNALLNEYSNNLNDFGTFNNKTNIDDIAVLLDSNKAQSQELLLGIQTILYSLQESLETGSIMGHHLDILEDSNKAVEENKPTVSKKYIAKLLFVGYVLSKVFMVLVLFLIAYFSR